MSKKIAIAAAVVVAAIILLLVFHGKGPTVKYITSKISRGDLVSYVEETGTLNPLGNTTVTVGASTATVTGGVTVGAQVTGLIKHVYVGFNTRVKKGQLLAQIDPTPYEAAVKQDEADVGNATAAIAVAQSNVSAAEAQLNQSRANLDSLVAQQARDKATLTNDKINYDREVQLVKDNYDSRQNLDNARYAYASQQAVVESDKALVAEGKAKVQASRIQIQTAANNVALEEAVLAKARAHLSQDKINLSYTRIVSPVNGIVIDKEVDVGQTVVSSFQSPNLFVLAQDLEKMQIDTLVDEADIGKIKVGQTALFNVDTLPTVTFHGKVAQIRINPINVQNVVDYDVVVNFDNPGGKLLPGTQADVKFIVADLKNVLTVPNQALRFVPPSEKTKLAGGQGESPKYVPHVWVLENEEPVRRNVTLGVAGDSQTQILSGASEGDRVITGIQTGKKGPRTLLF